MKYAIFYSFEAQPEFGASPEHVYAEALDQIARADELGLYQVWLTEHHFIKNLSRFPTRRKPLCSRRGGSRPLRHFSRFETFRCGGRADRDSLWSSCETWEG